MIYIKAKSIAKDPKDVRDEIRDRWPAQKNQNPKFLVPKKSSKMEIAKG
jgi:hypothetical protein